MSPEQRLALDAQRRAEECAKESIESADSAVENAGESDEWSDTDALVALASAGADLSEPRHVRHYLYLLSEGAAYLAAGELSAAGWFVEVAGPEGGEDDWLVLAQDLAMIVDEEKIRSARLLFQDLAERFVGEYEGWEASV